MAYTGQQLVNDLRSEIIEPSPTFFSDSRMLYLINLAQRDYVRRTRCLQASAFASTVQGQDQYPMPANWLAAEKIFVNYPVNGIDSWRPLKPTSIEKMAQESPNFLSSDSLMQGVPQKYWIFNQVLNVYPKPLTNGASDIFMFFDAKPIDLNSLSEEIQVDDSLIPGIRAYVLWKLWKQDGEDTKAAEEKANYEFEIGQGLKWKKQRVLDGKWKIDIESFLPYNYSSINNSAFNNQINPLNL